MDNKISAFVNSLDAEEKDELYRHLWRNYVINDIKTHAETLDISTSEEMLDVASELFVAGGYDCNLSYWENIEYVIKKVNYWLEGEM